MSIANTSQLERALKKLKLLEGQAARTKDKRSQNARLSELTLRSLTQLINQLKEEIARFRMGASD